MFDISSYPSSPYPRSKPRDCAQSGTTRHRIASIASMALMLALLEHGSVDLLGVLVVNGAMCVGNGAIGQPR
jgi:hypothetical protein